VSEFGISFLAIWFGFDFFCALGGVVSGGIAAGGAGSGFVLAVG
jgi:hypothetical protein